jgi:hypothetical protein
MTLLALDIGGANLKAADGLDFAASVYFPLWLAPEQLPEALRELVSHAPHADRFAVTMTGELADCFETKAEGVATILDAVTEVAGRREVGVYLTDGSLVGPAVARAQPLLAAASNWHALARFAGQWAADGPALLLDIGSTTCDVIPLDRGQPDTIGRTDPERLASDELVYTGVQRSPVCAVVDAVPWRGRRCPTAQELFATTWDVYLMLGDLPEEPQSRHTADGRPATRSAARDRLARSICADRDMFDDRDAHAAAATIAHAQSIKIASAVRRVLERSPSPNSVVTCGIGEFLTPRILRHLGMDTRVISLKEQLGAERSQGATAYALAVLVEDRFQR